MMNFRTFIIKANLRIRPFNGGKEKALKVSILDNLQIKTFVLKSKPFSISSPNIICVSKVIAKFAAENQFRLLNKDL